MQDIRGTGNDMTKPVSFLVVDDHPIFRQGLVALIKCNKFYTVSIEAGSIGEALEALERSVPDIALIDISLDRQNGLDLVRKLKSGYPEVPILIISMHDEIVYAARALKAGARGYIMKHEAASVIMEAIKTVLDGKIYISEAMRDRIFESMFNQPENAEIPFEERLSERELEVLKLIGQGFGASEIANTLHLSVKTVNIYRDHLKEKLQLADASELRRFAIKWEHSRDR